MRPRLKALLTAMILVAAGCDDDPTQEQDRSITQVVVNASTTQVEAGQLTLATAVARQADGTLRGDVDIIWTVSDTSIAEIVEEHLNSVLLRGKKAGSVTVSARVEQKTGTVTLSVTVPPAEKPIPELEELDPSAATEGGTGMVLHVKGRNFVPDTYVQWNGVARQTAYLSATELTVIVTPLDVATAGDAQVKVITPGPGGGVTGAKTFTIFGPPASIQIAAAGPLPEIFLPGEQMVFEAIVKDRHGRFLDGLQVSWSTAVPATASIDANGRVRMVGPGQTRIFARYETLVAEGVVNVAADPGADVIYDALEDGVRQLFITTPHVGGRRKLMQGIVHGVQPAVSPDGQRIAFVGTGANGAADIYVVNRDGTGLRQLTTSPFDDRQPAWSPDGQRIAFTSNRTFGYHDIWIMNADGSGLENVTSTGVVIGTMGYEHPAWSPDGQYLVFEFASYGMTPRYSKLIRMRLSDRSRSSLTPEDIRGDAEPAYSSDGRSLVFRRTFHNSLGDQIQFMNPMTGEAWLFIDYPGPGRNPSFSPNNSWIAFESTARNSTSAGAGVYLNWIGTAYRRTIGAGNAAGSPANPVWFRRQP